MDSMFKKPYMNNYVIEILVVDLKATTVIKYLFQF